MHETIDITSRFLVVDAVKRLSAAVAQGRSNRGLKPRLAGEVSAEEVRLYRHRPYARNGVYPRFVGAFIVVEGRTVLRGGFTESFRSRIGAVASYGLVGIVAVGLLVSIFFGRAGWRGVVGLVFVAGFATILYALSRLGEVNSRIDAEFLLADLKRILG